MMVSTISGVRNKAGIKVAFAQKENSRQIVKTAGSKFKWTKIYLCYFFRFLLCLAVLVLSLVDNS